MMQCAEHSEDSLYSRIAGSSWKSVPTQVRSMHLADNEAQLKARGVFRVTRGPNFIACFLCSLMGLPKANDNAEVRLTVTQKGDREHWARTFNGKPFVSTQWMTSGHVLVERSGCVEFHTRLIISENSLIYEQCACKIGFGWACVKLPAWFAPRICVTEQASDDGTCSHVSFSAHAPLVGHLISYQGDVRPVSDFGTSE